MHRCALVVTIAALAAAARSQTIVPYGAGCGARATTLEVHGSPTPGGSLEVEVARAAPSGLHALLVGASRTRWTGGSLPWLFPPELGFAPGCQLLVAPDLAVPLAIGAGGSARLDFILPAGAAGDVYVQALGAPGNEPAYATAATAIQVAAAPPATVTGRVTMRAGGAPLGGARVTLFTPGLGTFAESRSDAQGAFALTGVPPGRYRLGVAARSFAYVEQELALPAGGAVRTFALDPDLHPGRWDIAGDTLPHTLDATDIALLLPDGRIFYCHDTEDPIVVDPVTRAKWFPAGSGSSQGCMNGTLLEDGSLILVGGQDGGNFRNAVRWVKRWEPTSNRWTRLADLLHPTGRWYPGLARLADGDLLVMGGGTAPLAVRTDTCERFDQATGTWSPTGSMGQAVEFPPSALLHNGLVLRTWGSPELYDPARGVWRSTGPFAAPNRGWPGHSDHSLIVLRDGRALAIGINVQSAGSQAAMAELYDPLTERWTARSNPGLKRMQTEVVPLPDGLVLVAGGDKMNQSAPVPDLYGIVKWCDLYDPISDRWRRVADLLRFREYHAVTVLVPDGRVLTTGGTNIKFRNTPLSADIEAYSPPYLFRGVRPRIDNLSTTSPQRGSTLSFDVTPATRLTSVVLIGTTSHTHWVEAGVPRRLELAVQQIGARASVLLPSDANLLPLGHYLLFGMVDDVPSVARVVRVRS